jgi:hypothetical protein
MQTCAECSIPLRVSGPCVHGGEWRCWSCHPIAKKHLEPHKGRWSTNIDHRAALWARPRTLAWLKGKTRKRTKEKARQAFLEEYSRNLGKPDWVKAALNKQWGNV